MSTPTGSLMVLDAGDVFAAVRHFNNAYPRATVRDLPPEDLRRAWTFLVAARAELHALIPRLELALDYTRAQKSASPSTETEPT